MRKAAYQKGTQRPANCSYLPEKIESSTTIMFSGLRSNNGSGSSQSGQLPSQSLTTIPNKTTSSTFLEQHGTPKEGQKLSALPLEIKALIPEQYQATVIETLEDLISFSEKFDIDFNFNLMITIMGSRHEDINIKFQKLALETLKTIIDKTPIAIIIPILIKYHHSNVTKLIFQDLKNAITFKLEKLALSIKDFNELKIFLKDAKLTNNQIRMFLKILLEDVKNDRLCSLAIHLAKEYINKDLYHLTLEQRIFLLGEYSSHENSSFRNYINSEFQKILIELKRQANDKRRVNHKIQVLIMLARSTGEPVVSQAIKYLQTQVLLLSRQDRIYHLIQLKKIESMAEWCNQSLHGEMNYLCGGINSFQKLKLFLKSFDSSAQEVILVEFLHIMESELDIDGFRQMQYLLQQTFKIRVNELLIVEDKIDLLFRVIKFKSDAMFCCYIMNEIKKLINDIPETVKRISILGNLQCKSDGQLASDLRAEEDRELKSLSIEDGIHVLRKLIEINEENSTLKNHYKILLRENINNFQGIEKAKLLITQLVKYKGIENSEYSYSLVDILLKLTLVELSILFDNLQFSDFESLGSKACIILLKGKICGLPQTEKIIALLKISKENRYLSLVKEDKEYLITKLFKIEFTAISKKIASVDELIVFCKVFNRQDCIKLLQRLCGFQESQRVRVFAMEALNYEIQYLEGLNKNFLGASIEQLLEIIVTAMDICTIDTCNNTIENYRKTILSATAKTISQYFSYESNCTSSALSAALKRLTQGNQRLYYDAHWQHEEKLQVFDPLFKELLLTIKVLLDKKTLFSWEELSCIFPAFVLSAVMGAYKPPSESFSACLMERAENIILEDTAVTADEAFLILQGILSLEQGKAKPQPTLVRCKLLLELTLKSMSLIEDETYKPAVIVRHLNGNNKTMAGDVMHLLLPLRQLTSHEFPDAVKHSLTTVINKLDSIVQLKFQKIRYRAFNEQGPRRLDGKTRVELSSLLELIELNRSDSNPKGLNYSLKGVSNIIILALKEGSFTFFVDDIRKYMKSLRTLVIDITDPLVQDSLSRMCIEAVSAPGMQELTPEIALDLLWINLVLSINSSAHVIPYTPEQQKLLIEKCKTLKITEVQARQLIEMKVLKCHRPLPFSSYNELDKQITSHSKNIIKNQGGKTYPFEKICFDEIKRYLNPNIKLCLNITCPQSLREIDISFQDNNIKIAINVDGSPHFDPVTGQKNMNTVFRNALLTNAGWHIFDINLVDLDANSSLDRLKNECKTIALKLNQMTKVVVQKSAVHPKLVAPPYQLGNNNEQKSLASGDIARKIDKPRTGPILRNPCKKV